MSDCNESTLSEKEALADKYLLGESKPFTQYQFERTAYFSVDPDSTPSQVWFSLS